MKKQFGRSMIEMLGILAIIGILSILSIAALKIAIRKKQANDIIEDVKVAGFIVQNELFHSLAITEVETNLNGYITFLSNSTFSTYRESETTYAIVLRFADEKLCNELKNTKVEWLEEITVKNETKMCMNANNIIHFYFNIELTGNTNHENNECRVDKDCIGENKYCNKGTCQKCPVAEIWTWYGSKCVNCSMIDGTYVLSGEECHLCDDYYSVLWTYQTNTKELIRCYKCENINGLLTEKNECTRCENRCYDVTTERCYYVVRTDAFIKQDCLNACQKGYFLWGLGGGTQQLECKSCSPTLTGSQYVLHYEICHACEEMFVTEEGDGYKRCVGCLNPYDGRTTFDECSRCKKRYWTPSGLNDGFGICRLST